MRSGIRGGFYNASAGGGSAGPMPWPRPEYFRDRDRIRAHYRRRRRCDRRNSLAVTAWDLPRLWSGGRERWRRPRPTSRSARLRRRLRRRTEPVASGDIARSIEVTSARMARACRNSPALRRSYREWNGWVAANPSDAGVHLVRTAVGLTRTTVSSERAS